MLPTTYYCQKGRQVWVMDPLGWAGGSFFADETAGLVRYNHKVLEDAPDFGLPL
jgi:hypothetical protein